MIIWFERNDKKLVKTNDAVKILKHIAVLREGNNNWKQEVNVVSWYGQEPRLDIRWWSDVNGVGGKGAIIRKEEVEVLKEVFENLSVEKLFSIE